MTLRAFRSSVPAESEQINDYIQKKLLESRKKASQTQNVLVGASISKMDELKKLAELRNSGVLTEVEFQQQKAKLLQ